MENKNLEKLTKQLQARNLHHALYFIKYVTLMDRDLFNEFTTSLAITLRQNIAYLDDYMKFYVKGSDLVGVITMTLNSCQKMIDDDYSGEAYLKQHPFEIMTLAFLLADFNKSKEKKTTNQLDTFKAARIVNKSFLEKSEILN